MNEECFAYSFYVSFFKGGLFGDVSSSGVNQAVTILDEVENKYGI